jgi:putative addiction module killer protein
MPETTPRELLEYVTASGTVPFREWLHTLKDPVTRARIRVRLNRVRMGNLGDCKPVGQGLLELRVPFGPGYRVYLSETGPRSVLLLYGGEKRGQVRDIERAQEYWVDYRRRSR